MYTLCNLEAPFIGDNLITLGHNITTMTPKPLLPRYSPSLQGLVNLLLEKNHNIRPNVKEMIKMIPASVKNRYKKPAESYNFIVKIQNPQTLPVLYPSKPCQRKPSETFQGLNISARKFNISDTPELPRTISRNLDKSKSRTTVHDLYKVS